MKYQKKLESAQPLEVEFIFSKNSRWDIWLCFGINEETG